MLATRCCASPTRWSAPCPRSRRQVDLAVADGFVWYPERQSRLRPVERVSRVPIDLLLGVDRQKKLLVENTLRFARGLPANNAMLWGSRGMGKSSLVKAAHAAANWRTRPGRWR